MFYSQYGEIAFFGGLTASPEPLQPGTTRCDVTPVRESQRLDGVRLGFGKIFAMPSRFFAEWQSKSFAGLAIFVGYCRVLFAQNTIPQTPLFFSEKQFHYLPSQGT